MSAFATKHAALPRSYLFVPGNRPERFDKALTSGADAVIVDLEDAVPPQEKDAARATVRAWLNASKPVVLRINAINTPWFQHDLALCRLPGVAAVMPAKAERAEDLALLGGSVPLIPLIESAAGFGQLRAIAAVPGVQRLAFGAIDFQLDLQMQAHYGELIHFRSQLTDARTAPGELCFARFRSRVLHEGFFEEDGAIWAPDGTLLAQSRQLAILMELPQGRRSGESA